MQDSIPLDLSRVLADPDPSGTKPRKNEQPRNDRPTMVGGVQDPPLLDDALFLACKRAVDEKKPVEFKAAIHNTDRTVGARLAGYIAQKYGDAGLKDRTIVATFEGSAGQSFGAFCINGMSLTVFGEANDYVGKSMAGGELVIRPPKQATYATNENAILGNTVLYGATGGTLYAAGLAGERFCVRNSGAVAVVEGVGDHACEYMTGGTVVVLGEFGRNFGAGMSGGIVFVYDPDNKLPTRLNPDMVKLERLDGEEDDLWLRECVKGHVTATDSRYAKVLDWRWGDTTKYFWRVVPK